MGGYAANWEPVEVQALWLNALWIASDFAEEWKLILDLGLKSFAEKFRNEETGGLYDVIDVNHEPGRIDAACRPIRFSQLARLPFQLIDSVQARSIVDLVELKLWTPAGLRSLAEDEPAYAPYYTGDQWHRDAAYHQGTVWTWLAGPVYRVLDSRTREHSRSKTRSSTEVCGTNVVEIEHRRDGASFRDR